MCRGITELPHTPDPRRDTAHSITVTYLLYPVPTCMSYARHAPPTFETSVLPCTLFWTVLAFRKCNVSLSSPSCGSCSTS